VTSQSVCPECRTPVEPHWEWCHHCGFDPEGRRPASSGPLLATGQADLSGSLGEPASFEATEFDASSFNTSEPVPSGVQASPGQAFDVLQAMAGRRADPEARVGLDPGPGIGAGPGFDPGPGFGIGTGPGFDPQPVTEADELATWHDDRLVPAQPAPPPPAFSSPSSLGPPPPPPPALDAIARPEGRSRGIGVVVPPAVRRVVGLGVVVLVAVAVMATLLAAIGGDTQEMTTTTLDPNAPPPIGQLQLGTRPTISAPGGVAPGWTTYAAPDGTFTANFPAAADAVGVQRTLGLLDTSGTEVAAQTGEDGPRFSVVALDLPTATTFTDSRDLFDHALATEYRETGIFVVPPGLRSTAYIADIEDVAAARGVALVNGRRAYVIETRGASDEDHHLFLSGFRWVADPPG
jgi:hypothetical protein